MTQIKKLQETKGKTISKYAFIANHYYIFFDDGSYVILNGEHNKLLVTEDQSECASGYVPPETIICDYETEMA